MTFRIENKFFIKKENLMDFKKHLSIKGATELYHKRKIESLYFENKKKEMFSDSMEGSLPRKKIRVRYYPQINLDQIYFEKKISSIEGRYKKRNVIKKDEFENFKNRGIYDQQYGICYPIIFVSYEREYLSIGDTRITIDKEIVYQEFEKKLTFKDPDLIIELKTSFKKDLDEIVKLFPFQNIRFSKYCNGYKIIFNA